MSNQKKITAAVSAVMSYLQEEEAALYMQAAAPESVAPEIKIQPAAPASLWGVSGRQAQMQMRNMMQLKAFHRIR